MDIVCLKDRCKQCCNLIGVRHYNVICRSSLKGVFRIDNLSSGVSYEMFLLFVV